MSQNLYLEDISDDKTKSVVSVVDDQKANRFDRRENMPIPGVAQKIEVVAMAN